MTSSFLKRASLAGSSAFCLIAMSASAALAAETSGDGNTAWMMTSTVLVLLMTLPGLALFYGGLVRTKNMLSVMTQCFAIAAILMLAWVAYGYSLAFTGNANASLNMYVGGICVHRLPDDICRHHAIAHHWGIGGTREVFIAFGVLHFVVDFLVLSNGTYGLVLGRA
jgi:ammonia channel protein AmtB